MFEFKFGHVYMYSFYAVSLSSYSTYRGHYQVNRSKKNVEKKCIQ